jgi:transposase
VLLPAEKLVFIDETGTRLDMTRTHGRAPEGQRLKEAVPRNRGRVTTLIGALTLKGMLAHMLVEGGTSGDVFVRFVEKHLVPALQPGQVVVWDNLGAHLQKRVRRAVERKGCRVVFLPPYSPEFNPIEEAWAKVKALLRRLAARTRQALHEAIASALAAITPSDIQGWFRHAGYLPAQPQ